ncbi:MAG: hypothetical protein QE271_05525 [Bacteriovoracaceae bacterium]|nr:hypothetical protein [Bacteriovoracaceae bacterium]
MKIIFPTFLFLFFLIFSCDKHFKQDVVIDDILMGSYEFQLINLPSDVNKNAIYSSEFQKKPEEVLLRFKSLSLTDKKMKTIYGCLISQLKEGRFYLTWHVSDLLDSCQISDKSISTLADLSGHELTLESEVIGGISVSKLKLSYRKSVKGEIKNFSLNYYLLNWKQAEIKEGRLLPARQREIFHSPFFKSSIEGVQFTASFMGKNASKEIPSLVIKNLPVSHYPDLVKCAEWDDQCAPVMDDKCHLCQQGYSQVMHGKCGLHGIRFCGTVDCGGKNKPPCHLGRSHIENEDFMGCSELSEEWLCHPGLILDCSAKPFPLCH